MKIEDKTKGMCVCRESVYYSLEEGRVEETTGDEAAEESVGQRRRQAIERAPLHAPFVHAFSALTRSLYAKPNQFDVALRHLPLSKFKPLSLSYSDF